jgi:hypothetical protein
MNELLNEITINESIDLNDIEICLNLLKTIIHNILKNPNDDKFKKVFFFFFLIQNEDKFK